MCRLRVMTCVPVDGIMQARGAPDEDRRDGRSVGGRSAWEDGMGQTMADPTGPCEPLLSRGTYAAHRPHSKDDPVAGQPHRARKHAASRTRGHAIALAQFNENGPGIGAQRVGSTAAHRAKSTAPRVDGHLDAPPPGRST
jgi:hypothetical protein